MYNLLTRCFGSSAQFVIQSLSLTRMPASNISRMPTQLRINANNFLTNGLFWNGTPGDDYIEDNFLDLCQRKTFCHPTLAMLFSAKEIKPNILSGQFAESRNVDVSTVHPGPGGDGLISQNPGKPKPLPPPPTPCDGVFALNTFSSDDYSFTTNPNDMNSVTSSDWGDEACEIDRQRSQHVQQLFNFIDQMLFEPECLKTNTSSNQPRNSSEMKRGLCGPSKRLESSDFASVKHLMSECEEWVEKFPHFRLHGVQIQPPLVNSRRQPQQWQPTVGQQIRPPDHHLDAPPPTMRRFTRSPETIRAPQIPLDLQNVSCLRLPASPLVIRGQKIRTSSSVNTTTWLNRSRVSRVASRTQVGAAHVRFPHPNNGRTPLSTLPEQAVTRLAAKSKKSLYSVRQWGSQVVKAPENQVMTRSPQCAVYMGSRTAKSHDGMMSKEALTQALVEIILNEVLEVLENGMSASEKLKDSFAVTAKLSKSLVTLNSKELENEGGSRRAMSPNLPSSTKTPSPSQLQDRNFAIAAPTSSISTTESRNTKFSITWPIRPDYKSSPKRLLDPIRTSPIIYGRSNTPGGRNRLQTGSTLPPIMINRPIRQLMSRHFRRPGNDASRLPSIFPTAVNYPDGEDSETNYHCFAKVSLHGRSNQTAVLGHLSHLREPLNSERLSHQMNVRRNHSCATKITSYPPKATRIEYSVEVSAERRQPSDPI
ncbi:protein FAM149 [Echinococcus multilocularis]|uniref:Protein FAM149 n=1 Tax=Echinococcus multilocularis TaxID=6211 RepID=A0A068XYL8_ECHMU|nr:protein FAM149 [Echinococcus multilocularis]